MKSIRQRIIDLGYQIAGDIDHGECFYDEGMLKEFIADLDSMKRLAKRYYEENKKEMEDE